MTRRPVEPPLVVVGAGIVGLATAVALAEAGQRVVVLEAEDGVARHQSGHNSGVIHSGLYYPPGSLKAELAVSGRQALYQLCEQHEIPHHRCGKLVLATAPNELPALAELERRGRANGLRGLLRLDREQIAHYEPHARGCAGLWVPETGVVDYRLVSRVLADRLHAMGGEVRLGWKLVTSQRQGECWRLESTAGDLEASFLVGCAGLESDRLARLCGVDPGLRIVPFRGDYFAIPGARSELVRGLIYPVPDPRFPFLGVHFTRRIDGTLEAGPNAVPALMRSGYSRWSFAWRDAIDTFGYLGFWRLAARYWRTGLGELTRAMSKRRFAAALARLVPGIRAEDLVDAGCGVRAQAVTPGGGLVDDFHIVEGPGSVHLVNAPSPAATAALAIGQQLAGRIERQLG